MKKLLLTTGLAFVLASGANTSASAQEMLYGAILKTLANPHWNAMTQGVEEAGKEVGVEVVVSTVENEGAAEQQLNNCETMLLREPTISMAGKR